MERLHELMKDCISDASRISEYLGIEGAEAETLREISEKYPVCSTRYYLDLIDKSDPDDPVKKMCIPERLEFSDEGAEDTSGEAENTVITGMQHKYRQTALILSTNQCAMYCRHCFRKRMVGSDADEIADNIPAMKEYLQNHTEINNVLISGGDSFLNTNERIAEYLDAFSDVENLDFIRFGTRTPVVMPQRITGDRELLNILEKYNRKKQIILVTQFNHANEITEESASAIGELMRAGIPVRNQTVLLKGINDDPSAMAELLNGLTKIGVIPYYVFQCRPARGVMNSFQVPLERGIEIMDTAKSMLNGQSKGIRFVMSHPTGKIELLGRSGDKLLCKYHQAKHEEDNARIFAAELVPGMCWIDSVPGK